MKKTRKYISVCLCVVMFASMCLCVGCQKKAETIEKKKKQIELWHYWDIPGNQQHLEELVDQFNQSQDEIEVKVSYIPDEDFKKQLALSMAEEKMPDIALVDSSDFQFLHQMKPFADLTDEIPELREYSEKALAPCSANGRIYGQPFGVNCTAMFYNKKILEKAGCKVPENWEEFKEVAEKVSDKMGYAPCTPSACMKVLDHYGIDCTGKKVVVIGRSLVVGKPAAMMLIKKNATVTVCHTRTVDMPSVVKEADIVVVAAGKAGVIDGSYLREGQIVIDVGINVNEEGKLCGDVNFEEAEKIVEAITPVPRGVGGVTTSILLEHVVDAAIAQNR